MKPRWLYCLLKMGLCIGLVLSPADVWSLAPSSKAKEIGQSLKGDKQTSQQNAQAVNNILGKSQIDHILNGLANKGVSLAMRNRVAIVLNSISGLTWSYPDVSVRFTDPS